MCYYPITDVRDTYHHQQHFLYLYTVRRNSKKKKKKRKMETMKAAVGDGLISFMWVSSASSLQFLSSIIAGYIGFGLINDPLFMASSAFINLFLLFILLSIFEIIGNLLGGASFNPTFSAAFSASGLGSSFSLYSAALRFPAQVLFLFIL